MKPTQWPVAVTKKSGKGQSCTWRSEGRYYALHNLTHAATAWQTI